MKSVSFVICFFAYLTFFSFPTWAGPNEDRALFKGIEALDKEGVLISLKNGANPNAHHPDGEVAISTLKIISLSSVIYEDRPEEVTELAQILFAHGARLNPYEGNMFLPISSGNLSLVKLFVAHGADVNFKIEGFTPHQIAVKYNQPDIAEYLVTQGALVTDHKQALQTHLVEAISDHDVNRINELLNLGAEINEDDGTGRTPLIAAIRAGIYNEEIFNAAKLLLYKGADPNKEGVSGFRDISGIPLHILVATTGPALNDPKLESNDRTKGMRKYSGKILRLLLEKGAKVSSMDDTGKTPLHIAAIHDNIEAARILIKRGAKVSSKDKSGKTPLDYAESAGMIKMLKKNGAKEL